VSGGLGAATAAAVGLLLAASAEAAPLSAIPWLSDSIAAMPPARPAPPPPRPPGGAGAAASDPADVGTTIAVTPLGAVSVDAVGLLAPEATGLPRALWGPASVDEARAAILGQPDRGPPATRALFRRILLAEADPPAGSGGDASLLIARLDRLLALGALEEAEALIQAAGPENPEIFRRWFDIGLLAERAEGPCLALRQNPALSPTLPARVFCLARGGDWNAAEITLTLGEDVGAIPEAQEALLARFLDPELFEDEPPPPAPDPLTALDFTLREAVGLPRPPGSLPLAFLWRDLDEHAPMRARVQAAERLARAGSLGPDALLAAYRAGAPAASGGFWDRARAIQAMDAALASGEPMAIAEAMAAAEAALDAVDLRVAFAQAYAPQFVALDPGPLPDRARARLARLLLLAGEVEAAARAAGPAPGRRMRGLLAVAGAGHAAAEPGDLRLAAALDGLRDRPAESDREKRIQAALDEGRVGETVLEALHLVAAEPPIDPQALTAALFALRAAGQEEAARAIALETLMLSGAR